MMLIMFVFVPFVMAQEPAPLEVEIVPQADVAATGERFEYTIVVTNSSNTPVREVVVSAGVPENATFFNSYGVEGWRTNDPAEGSSGGRVIWFHEGEFQPGAVAKLRLIVEVVNELDVENLQNDVFILLGAENRKAQGSGPTAEVAVRTATPAVNPTLTFPQMEATQEIEGQMTATAVMNLTLTPQTPTVTSTPQPVEATPTNPPPPTVEESAAGETPVPADNGGGLLPSCFTGLVMLFGLGMVRGRRSVG